MKVLHIFNSLRFSGAEIMYTSAASLFIEKGCELHALATAQELGEFRPVFESAGYKVSHMPMPHKNRIIKKIVYYIQLVKFIRNNGFKIIHIHSHAAMWGSALCSRIAGVKTVYTFHNVFPSQPIMYLYHFLKRWSAKIFFRCRFQTISDTVYLHELNFYHNKTQKIYNWYNKEKFYPASVNERFEIRISLKIDNKAFVLISVGGCSEIKRHTDIIKAMPAIIQKIPDCIYLHLGSGDAEHDEMKLAENLGVLKRIYFLGNQENVRKYLIASDVYVMTSKFEGISLTTIEAMACQIPAILYNVPGLKDFNAKGENCILIEPEFKLLPDNILKLTNDSAFKRHMILGAEEFVNTNFDMAKNVENIFHMYKKENWLYI